MFGKCGPHLRSSGRSTAQSYAKLEAARRNSAGTRGLSFSPAFPVSISAETAGRFSHVPRGAAGPVSTPSAAFAGSGAVPEEGEERERVLSGAGKASRGAVSEVNSSPGGLGSGFLRLHLWETSPWNVCCYPNFPLNVRVNGGFRLFVKFRVC